MVLFFDATTKVQGFTPGFSVPTSLPGFSTFVFDESTNAALAADIPVNFSQYTVVAGVLQKNGVPQVITAASATFTTLQSATASITETQFDTILGVLQSGSATLAQVNTILFNVLLKLRKAGLI